MARRKHTARKWTESEEAYLRKHYADGNTAGIARRLKRTPSSVYEHAHKLGIFKSYCFKRAVMAHCNESPASKAMRFKPGHTPMNKGRKMWQYMSKDGIERTRATQFKPGCIPHNVKPVGYERVNHEGYLMVKVEGRNAMVRKHIWTWEQHNGPVPRGMVVVFRDGNRLNCDISNLVLRTRSEMGRIMIMQQTPEERERRMRKIQETRNETIRKDKMRIRWGLDPKTRLVKKWYAPERSNIV